MDLRQYLIAPHERPQQQPARHDIPIPYHQNQRPTKTLDPRLAQRMPTVPATFLEHEQSAFPAIYSHTEVGHHDERSQQSQQHTQQRLSDHVVTREQVINGLAAYPDILAAIFRSGHIPTQTPNDTRESAQHTPPTTSQVTTTLSRQISRTSAPTPAATSSSSSTPTTARTFCFWHYHLGTCSNDPLSPTYKSTNRPCLYLHSTSNNQETRVQQGKPHWHRQMGDCGLELCIFSSNYKVQEEKELTVQQKTDYRKWKSEGKKRVKAAALAHEPVVDGLGGGGIEEEVEEQDVNTSSETTISHQEQDLPDTASTTQDSITPIIPTSPKAGRYAKGSRLQQPSTSSPIPTPSTLKRKAFIAPSQDTRTPASKKPKTGPSASISATHTMAPGSVVPELSKSAAKRLRRQAKKAVEKAAYGKTQDHTAKMQNSTAGLGSTAKPLDTVSDIPSDSSHFLPIFSHTTTPLNYSSHTKPSQSKPSQITPQQTCFLWYHNSCPKKGKKCTELHALTNPPSYVVTPEGYVHVEGVCGQDWCAGDWRSEGGVDGDVDEESELDGGESEGEEGEESAECEGEEINRDFDRVENGGNDEDGFEEQGHEQFTEEERDSYWDYKGAEPQSIAKDDSEENEDDAATEGE